MYSDLIHFIYKATNGIAAKKYDPEAECVLSEIVEQELRGINSRLLKAGKEEERLDRRRSGWHVYMPPLSRPIAIAS